MTSRRRDRLLPGLAILIAAQAWAETAAPSRIQIVYATPATQPQIWENGEKQVIQRFMAENPDIEVISRQIPFEAYDTQILLAVRGGHGPDVARVNHSTIRMWAGAGYLMELDDFIAQSDVIDPADYWEGFWEFCRVGGKQYAVPLGTDCRVLLYHLGLFKRAGLMGPPKTWPELVEAAKRIHRPADKVYGIALPSAIEWSVAYDVIGNFLVANGGHILAPDGTRSVLAEDPRAREAFRFVCELSTVHDVCPPGAANLGGDVIEALFVDGRLGMMVSGPWVRENFERLRPGFAWQVDYGTALIPAGPARGRSGSSQGGWLVGAFAATRHREAALRLLEFFQRPESLATVAAVENLPPRRAAMTLGPFADPYYRVFFEQLPDSRPPLTVVPQLPLVARLMRRAYQRVVAGGGTVDEAIAWLDSTLTNHLLR